MSNKEQGLVIWDKELIPWLQVKIDGMVLTDSFINQLPKSPHSDISQATLWLGGL